MAADETAKTNLIAGIIINSKVAESRLFHSPAITTALSPYIGYHKAAELAKEMKTSGVDIFEANQKLQFLDEARLKQILEPQNLLKIGYSIRE